MRDKIELEIPRGGLGGHFSAGSGRSPDGDLTPGRSRARPAATKAAGVLGFSCQSPKMQLEIRLVAPSPTLSPTQTHSGLLAYQAPKVAVRIQRGGTTCVPFMRLCPRPGVISTR